MIYGHPKVSAFQTELIIPSSSSFSFPALFNVIAAHLDTEVRNLGHLQLWFSSITPGEPSAIVVKWFSMSFLSLSSLFQPTVAAKFRSSTSLTFLPAPIHSWLFTYLSFPFINLGRGAFVSFIFEFLSLSWELVLLQECSQVVISPNVHPSLPPSWVLLAKLTQCNSQLDAQSAALYKPFLNVRLHAVPTFPLGSQGSSENLSLATPANEGQIAFLKPE